MSIRTGIALAALCAFTLTCARAHAQPLFEAAIPIGGEPAVVSVPFTVPADTSADWTIADLGTPGGTPPPLDRLYVALLRGSALIESSDTPGTQSLALTAGEYELQIVGVPEAAAVVGSLSVTLRDIGGGPIIVDTVQAFELPHGPVTSPAAFEHSITVTAAGAYEVRISDLAHPAVLASLTTLVIPAGGSPVGTLSGSGVVTFAATPGVYEVFVFADLAPTQERGLVGVAFGPTAGAPTFSAVNEIGAWPHRYGFDVAAATTLTTTVTDLGFPQPLIALAAILTGNGQVIHRISASASASASTAVAPGAYAVYLDAAPVGANASGSFGLIVENSSGQRPLATARAVVDESGPLANVGEQLDTAVAVTQAGDYTVTLVDFGLSGFFDPFDAATLAVTDNRQVISSMTTPGSLTFTAQPGSYSLVVIANPAGTNGSGLLGLSVRGGSANSIVYDQTAGVGTSFYSRQVAVGGAASLDFSATDLGFPGDFEDLRIAVTRGAEREGEIFGGGTFSVDATPGTYFVNLLASADSVTGYSTLGLSVEVTPVAPTVVLSASATGVQVGGRVTLTWSSTGSTSCVASGAWTGDRGASGTVTVGPLNAISTFTLTCTGPGGVREASVRIDITPEQRSGGGGAIGLLELLLLTATLLAGRSLRVRRGLHDRAA